MLCSSWRLFTKATSRCRSPLKSPIATSAAEIVGEARCALQQSAVQIEDVARVGLASGWSAQEQRHLAIRHRVLREVVVDAERVADERAVDGDAVLHDLLADRAAGERCEVLQRCRIFGAGDDDHLAQMMELLGRMPKNLALSGKNSKKFFDSRGNLRKINGLSYWPVKKVLTEKYMIKD